MSKPVICIITSSQCGHCVTMRLPTLSKVNVKGPISGNSWSYDFFTMLLFGVESVEKGNFDETSEPHFRVYNIHTPTMRSANISMSEVTEFVWTGNSDKPINVVNVSNDRVPESIFNYVKAFPTFAYFDGDTWDEDVKNGTEHLYGIINMYNTIFKSKVNGKNTYTCDPSAPFNKKPHQIAENVRVNGLPPPPMSLEPHKAPGLTYGQELQSRIYKESINPTPRIGSVQEDSDIIIEI